MVHRRNVVAAAGLAGAGIGAALLADRLDRRRIAADPLWERLQSPPSGERRTVAGAGGVELNVEVYGPADAPPVVLVHGWMCALRFWRLQVQDLMSDHRLIVYDMRGHGESRAPADGDWSLDTLADDLEAVFDACVPGGEALLAGHSLGAMTIAAWAGRHRDSVIRRTHAVAMFNTGLGDIIQESLLLRTPLDRIGGIRQAVGGALLGAAAPLPQRPDPVSHRAVRQIALCADASPAAVRFSEDMLLRTKPRVRAACGREMARMDLLHAVEHLTVPTLVVHGDKDLLTPKAHAERLAEALPDCVGNRELPECGHMGPLERPDEVTDALRSLTSARQTSSSAAGAR
jgi:pimeloyl-ACP methyl ester carboxylesterase